MYARRAAVATYTAGRSALSSPGSSIAVRTLASVAAPVATSSHHHKVVVIGAGSAGLCISHQLLRSGRFKKDEIAVVDPEQWHHFQPGWTLVGGGLKDRDDVRKPLKALLDPKIKFYQQHVGSFSPSTNSVQIDTGRLSYDHLVVVPGIDIKYSQILGLPEALANPKVPVSTIYGYETCPKVFRSIKNMKSGNAIFTQPAGIVKCAGAAQKAMWMALDHWKQAGLYNSDAEKSAIHITFATGIAAMFGVPKYSDKLEQLRKERGVEGLFQHDLQAIEGNVATFSTPEGVKVARQFDMMHVVPKMGPHAFMQKSPLVDEAGFVDVSQETTRHKTFPNVWSVGDASNLPTSKTMAAITAQAPVLVSNLMKAIDGKAPTDIYDGYTSCPIVTEYGKVLLAEFKYGGKPKETFGAFGLDQGTPRRAFYHLKKDFFPWVYYKAMVKGAWGGPKGFIRQR